MIEKQVSRPWPGRRSRLSRSLLGLLVRSSSESYVQCDWHPAGYSAAEAASKWPSFVGDTEVGGLLQRNWRYAGVVMVRREPMSRLRYDHPHGLPAAASISLGGKVRACILPEDFGHMEVADKDDMIEEYASVACRIGPKAKRFMAGLIIPSTSEFAAPPIDSLTIDTRGPVQFSPKLPDEFGTTKVV
ncbi:MAG TPA: hypothetical protein VJ836_03320 [Candidatus Saccharimonadales bacterium]|nr:hypothetical protein [Candidatus Saccharimonadales bacterium]